MSEPPILSFLGPFSLMRDHAPVPLPQSRKTRALLAYLAVTGRAHRRERLTEMFWDVTDDPRGALRWSLSKLRVLDDDEARRIIADRRTVAFEPAGALVDTERVHRAVAVGLDELGTAELRELAGLFRGGFLDGLELDDFEEFRVWRMAQREHFRALQQRVLRTLVERLDDVPEEAVVPARELVRLAPGDEQARARLVELLVACGRLEEAEEHYSLGKRQLERTGRDRGLLRKAWRRAQASTVPEVPVPEVRQQEVRFCKGYGGVRIAWASLGEGPALVKTANWMTHIEYDWKSPLWRHLARELSRDFRLVRYDQRGNGLSDWTVDEFSLDAWVGDLEAVVDAAALDRFPLLGISQGCRVAIAYAVRHPERVSHLVLYGGGARGWRQRDPGARERREGLQALIREGWGQDIPAFRQVFTTLFMPGASPEQAEWFNELQRASTSAENAVRITEASGAIDVTELLADVRAPTLVLHATHDAMVPFQESRILAAGIDGARFVALESHNHLLLDDEPAFARFLGEIREFLAPAEPRG